MQAPTLFVFPSKLGWMALLTAGATVKRLTFGHRTAAAAKSAVEREFGMMVRFRNGCGQVSFEEAATARSNACGRIPGAVSSRLSVKLHGRVKELVRRLQAYAAGAPDDFVDVDVDLDGLSEFQRRVIGQCRRVPYGATISYAELAARAGSPGAARAVGNCMAANRIPLIIPCHRVVRSDGRLGAYSAPGGTQTKRRLLALESQST